jgi:D-alanyl-D-alanine dipeptidase
MSHFTLISDARVLRIPIKDNGEPTVDLANRSWVQISNFKHERNSSSFKVRESVAMKLRSASAMLPAGTKFLVVEGLRPLALQQEYFRRHVRKLSQLHPEWSPPKLEIEASKFVAPPENVPPHTTGAAVDLTLVHKMCELDMGTAVNDDPEASAGACFTYSRKLSRTAKKNRELLIAVLSDAGFVNYPTEWWHWSYGDRYWAWRTRQPFAIYGPVSEPHETLIAA